MCIDLVLAVIMRGATYGGHGLPVGDRRGRQQHPPHGGAAPTPSCLVGPRRKEILPFSNSKKKWSFSELRTFFPKNLLYRRVDFLRNLRSRGKLQSFLRVGLYCTDRL